MDRPLHADTLYATLCHFLPHYSFSIFLLLSSISLSISLLTSLNYISINNPYPPRLTMVDLNKGLKYWCWHKNVEVSILYKYNVDGNTRLNGAIFRSNFSWIYWQCAFFLGEKSYDLAYLNKMRGLTTQFLYYLRLLIS